MSWMAIYYANMIAMRSDLEREAERHRETAIRLREAKDMADAANRAKSNFIELKIEEFDLNEMVREIVANVRPMVADNSNRLMVKCRSDLGIVLTDQTKLRQAALN